MYAYFVVGRVVMANGEIGTEGDFLFSMEE